MRHGRHGQVGTATGGEVCSEGAGMHGGGGAEVWCRRNGSAVGRTGETRFSRASAGEHRLIDALGLQFRLIGFRLTGGLGLEFRLIRFRLIASYVDRFRV